MLKFCSISTLPITLKSDFISFLDQLLQIITHHQMSLLPFPSEICYKLSNEVLKNGINSITIYTLAMNPSIQITRIRRISQFPYDNFLSFLGQVSDNIAYDIPDLAQTLTEVEY